MPHWPHTFCTWEGERFWRVMKRSERMMLTVRRIVLKVRKMILTRRCRSGTTYGLSMIMLTRRTEMFIVRANMLTMRTMIFNSKDDNIDSDYFYFKQ